MGHLGNGHIVMQVLEGHRHGVKRQHHATGCLALAIPAHQTMSQVSMVFLQLDRLKLPAIHLDLLDQQWPLILVCYVLFLQA